MCLGVGSCSGHVLGGASEKPSSLFLRPRIDREPSVIWFRQPYFPDGWRVLVRSVALTKLLNPHPTTRDVRSRSDFDHEYLPRLAGADPGSPKKYEVPGWPARLDKWGRELDQLESEKLKAHLLRTRKPLGGMGSISDIVICPEAGYNVPNGESVIKAANDVLLSLVRKLDAEVSHLLSTLPG